MDKPDPLLDLAMQLEEIALADDFFVSRKLYPNVDFYTGLIYKAMGFPTRMFTVLFALGRLPGWIAQWREMMADPATKLGRPRQIYTGPTERPYVPIGGPAPADTNGPSDVIACSLAGPLRRGGRGRWRGGDTGGGEGHQPPHLLVDVVGAERARLPGSGAVA